MRKVVALSMIMLIRCLFVYAQNTDTSQYYGKMDYVFEHVNKTPITSGMLRDYGIEFLNLDNYTGTVLHDSNYVGLSEWRMLYASLYSSQINNSNTILYLDTVNRLINRFAGPTAPLSFVSLNYYYQRLRDDALSSNLLTESNEKLYDVAGRPTHPFQTEELFAVAPLHQTVLTGANQFIFRPELFLGNTGKSISSIAYTVDGGSSYQAVAFNTPFSVSFSTQGFHDFNIRVTYTDNSIRYSHTRLLVREDPGVTARYGGFWTTTNVVASKPYLGVTGRCEINIELAQNNATGQIRKPLIVVEGFDADGSFTYGGRADGLVQRLDWDLNTGNFITLNSGLDNVNDYDMIFVNWANGADHIQRNAFVLEEVIALVNSLKTTWNGVRQQNVIVGMSMGGLVARYALRDMEVNSQNHETRLFISHDTPHWGANVPVGAQAAVQHLAPWRVVNFRWDQFLYWTDMFPEAVSALAMFNSPAARQMLIQRYILNAPSQSLSVDNAEHDAFLSELNALGWPVNCRNLTLSNGSCNGTKVFPDNSLMFTMEGDRNMTYFGAMWRSLVLTVFGGTGNAFGIYFGWGNPQTNTLSALLEFPLSLFATKSSIGVDFKIRAVPSSGTQEIYRGDIYSKKKILWVINVKTYFMKCRVQSSGGMLPLDNAPGGMYDLNEFGVDANIINGQLPSFFSGYVTASVLQPRFCFVPTVSSLAFTNPAANLTANVCGNIACGGPVSVHDFFAPQQNQLHMTFTQPNADWILQRQNANFTCAKVCPANFSISGPANVCSSAEYVLTGLSSPGNITWNGSQLNLASLTPGPNNNVTVTKTTSSSGPFTLSAALNNACDNSAPTITKAIHIGTPYLVQNAYSTSYNAFNEDPRNNPPVAWNQVCNLQQITTSVLSYGGSSISWDRVYANPTNTHWEVTNNNVNFYFWGVGQQAIFRASTSNSCGSSSLYFPFMSINCTTDPCEESLKVTPNPANAMIMIPPPPPPCESAARAAKAGASTTAASYEIQQVKVYDLNGVLKLTKKIAKGTVNIQVDVSGLKEGVYFIETSNGVSTRRKMFMVKR